VKATGPKRNSERAHLRQKFPAISPSLWHRQRPGSKLASNFATPKRRAKRMGALLFFFMAPPSGPVSRKSIGSPVSLQSTSRVRLA